MPQPDPEERLLRAIRASRLDDTGAPDGVAHDDGSPDAHLLRIGRAMHHLYEDDDVARDDRTPPPSLWRAIAEELDIDAGTVPVGLPDTAGADADIVELASRARSGRRRRGWWLSVAAAVVVLGVLVAGAVMTNRRSGSVIVAETILEPLEGSGQGEARLIRADGDQNRLEVKERFGGVPDGDYIEVWLIDPDSDLQRMVSLGAIQGTGTFEVPAGIDPARYRLVDISIEPADGQPTHSGRSVLRGTLPI